MAKIGFISLGCPKNQVDAELMLDKLVKAGYEIAGTAEEADAVIVNTCGFIDAAKQEVKELEYKLKMMNEKPKEE